MQIQSLEKRVNERPSKPQLTTSIASCDSEGLLRKNMFQMNIFEIIGLAEEKWAEFLLGKTENNLSYQMRKYYCLNLCENRGSCQNAQELGWVNTDIDYPATFLGKVYVVPDRNNSETPYKLFRIN